ncbi:MAG: hypothetical protein Q9195_008400, partial [Heterodermia aff. obscurata]
MQISTLLPGLALAASTAVAQTSTGESCPSDSVSRFNPCLCPYGTGFQYSTTWATLGVNAKDFSNYTSSFYNLAWIGATNLTRNGIDQGPDKTVGTTRTFDKPTSVGVLTFTEKLDSFQTLQDGSYIMRFSLFNVPVAYKKGKEGSFAGYWVTLDAQWAGKWETVVRWDVSACLTGTPFDFAKLHVDALDNLLKAMDKAGLVKGKGAAGP